jgi:hypothetical protein
MQRLSSNGFERTRRSCPRWVQQGANTTAVQQGDALHILRPNLCPDNCRSFGTS